MSKSGYVETIKAMALRNTCFRQVIFTGKNGQLAVMCLQPGEEIGDALHTGIDQFFRIADGEARFAFDKNEERLVRDGDEIVVLAKVRHNVINTSKATPLKLYTISSPPSHPHGTMHKTGAEARAQSVLLETPEITSAARV